MKALTFVLLLGLAVSAAPFFVEDFEDGSMARKTGDQVIWEGNNRTSVVTMENGVPVAVYNNGPIHNVADAIMPDGSTRDWTAKNGNHSLRFRYPAGEAWSEQRYRITTPRKEIWVSYWIRVPHNFAWTNGYPNKFFSIWMDGYSQKGDGSSVWLCMEQKGTGANLWFSYSDGGYKSSNGAQQSKPFINTATDLGRWMHIVFHAKAQSAPGASDGIVESYRKWEGEADYTKLHETFSAPLKVAATVNGFGAGYLMGWANAAYAVDTEWLMDDVTWSEESLLEGSAGIQTQKSRVVRNAPACQLRMHDVFGRTINSRRNLGVRTIAFDRTRISLQR